MRNPVQLLSPWKRQSNCGSLLRAVKQAPLVKIISSLCITVPVYTKNNSPAFLFRCPGYLLLLLVLIISYPELSTAQTKKTTATATAAATDVKSVTRILFLLDASSSMLNPWEGKTKMDVARSVIAEIADSLPSGTSIQTALRVYGHQSINTANDCNDTKLEVSFAVDNASAIRARLNAIRPKGITPLALSLEKSADDFPYDANARNIVVLVTDGEESCGGDPCAVSLLMQQKQVYLKPFVIGLNLDPSAYSAMDCIGNYFNVQQQDALRSVMKTVVQRITAAASVRVNLLDEAGNPLETDVNMTFYDAATGIAKYNFYHTLNYRGIPDTLQLDPVISYNVVIHTNPPIESKALQFNDLSAREINIPASQGFLKVELSSSTIHNNLNSKIKCIVRKAGSPETVQVQDMNTSFKYLSGSYDLEILTLPRIQLKNIAITQSSTTTVKIDVPGVVTISKTFPGFGAIFINDNGRLVKIYSLNENLSNELVGLQAGEYTAIFRPKSSKRTTESITKTFQIKSGQSFQLKL